MSIDALFHQIPSNIAKICNLALGKRLLEVLLVNKIVNNILHWNSYREIAQRPYQFLRLAILFTTLFLTHTALLGQSYRLGNWQDGRALRQGKFLIGAGWEIGGLGFTATPATVTSVPALSPSLRNPALGTMCLGMMYGGADNWDVGLEIGGTYGGPLLATFVKYALLPYSSPFQVAAMASLGVSSSEIQFGPNATDSAASRLLGISVPDQERFLRRAQMFVVDVSVPLSYDISSEWSLLLTPRIASASYAAGIGFRETTNNGSNRVTLTETEARSWFYGFSIGAKAVRESPQWWQYLLPVPFLASGAAQLSFTWAQEQFYQVSIGYQHLFPSFGTLLTTVTQDEMDAIQEDRRRQDSILAAQNTLLELQRSRFGRALSAEIVSIKGTDSLGAVKENPTLHVEEFEMDESIALLPMIFFEHHSHVLPSRYRRIRSSDRTSFTVSSSARQRNNEAYRNILNIIGKRMSDASSATLTLTGCTSGIAEEAGNTELAERRARAIADYLVDVWKIAPQRFLIQTRPRADTNGLGSTNPADTRRVELRSDNSDILAPILTQEILRRPSLHRIEFTFDIAAGAGLKQWNFELTQLEGTEVQTLRMEAGNDASLNTYIWAVGETQASVPSSGENVVARLEITDLTNRVAESSLALLPVEYITLAQKRRSPQPDTKLFRVRNWIMSVGESGQSQYDSTSIAFIRRAITPSTRIYALSQLSDAVKASLEQALGKKMERIPSANLPAPQHPLLLPEERFYARAIALELRTPILAKQ